MNDLLDLPLSNQMLSALCKADDVEVEALQRAMGITSELQRRIFGRMLFAIHAGADRGGHWNPFWVRWLRRGFDEIAQETAQRYSSEVGASHPRFWLVGHELVDAGIAGALGVMSRQSLVNVPLPTLHPREVGIAATWAPETVQSMARHIRDVLVCALAANVLTGESPHQLKARLVETITTQGSPFHKISKQAEFLTCLETRRIQWLGIQLRMEQAVARWPQLKPMRVLLVAAVDGLSCTTCKPVVDRKSASAGQETCVTDAMPVNEAQTPWDPDKHPRGEGGRFTSTGAGSGARDSARNHERDVRRAQRRDRIASIEYPQPTEDELQDYRDRGVDFRSKAVITPHPGLEIEVTGFNDSNGELNMISDALSSLPRVDLEGISGIHVSRVLLTSDGELANGLYVAGARLIKLGRQARDFSTSSNIVQRVIAIHTLHHEVGHHWFEKLSRTKMAELLILGRKRRWKLGNQRFRGREFAAEAYARLHACPWTFENSYPETYNFIMQNSGATQ